VHPLHDESAAELLTVSPPPPLLIKPQADISLLTFLLLHEGQLGFSFPNSRSSKFRLQSLQ